MLGLAAGVVRLQPYTPAWRQLFFEEQARLHACIGAYVLDIQHIGSTSIPGMAAKPILDIGVAVRNFEEAVICIEPLVRLGYAYRGEQGLPRRHYFVRGEPRTHHLHMTEIHGADWVNTIWFRDYLRRHPEMARAYADLKQQLAQRYEHDRPAYQDSKNEFITRILRLAQPGGDASER